MVDTPNFRKGTGRLAVDRMDFENHLQGRNPDTSGSHYVQGFRHKASQIDVDDPSAVFGNPSTVEAALEGLNDLNASILSAGQGFVTIGDGYNTWHNADGVTNFDPSIPSLDTLLNDIFDAMYAGQPLPDEYARIQKGGILVIKAGTYTIANTVNVPPGITIMGEGYGTKLVNITSLDIPALGIAPTPKGSPTPLPMFTILPDLSRTSDDEAVDPNTFMFARASKFMNMIICDNFVEPTILGDVYYLLAQNKTGDTPLIQQQTGSNLELENVYLMGRVNFTSGTIVSAATRFAIQLETSSGNTDGTILKLNNCFIDGFSQPIQFASIGATNDYLEVSNSKIRSHGYLDGDGTSTSTNCIINMNDNNATITSNYLYGNHTYCNNITYIGSAIVSTPTLQAISKILVSNNNLAINKTGNIEITPVGVSVNTSIAPTIVNKATILVYGNNFQDSSFKIESSRGSYLDITYNRAYLPNGVKYGIRTVDSSPYTVDSTSPDHILLVKTLFSAKTINLPAHDAGRKLVIMDSQGYANVNNITLVRNSSLGKINNTAGSLVMNTAGQAQTLISDGTNWYTIHTNSGVTISIPSSYRASAVGGGTSGTGDRTATITPVVGDLFIVFCAAAGNTNAAPTCTDNNSGSYSLIGTALFNGSANIMSAFVRTTLLANTTSTVVTVATGSNTAAEVVVIAIAGLAVTGLTAIRGYGTQVNQTATVPAPVLSGTSLSSNITVGAIASAYSDIVKTFYFDYELASGSSHGTLIDGGTPASYTGTAPVFWNPGAQSFGKYSPMKYGTVQTSDTFVFGTLPSASPGTDDCFRTANTYTGTFASGNWTVTLRFEDNIASIPLVGTANFRVFRGTNVSGSGATEITSGIVSFDNGHGVGGFGGTGNGSTPPYDLSITFNPGAVSLTSEYIFIKFALYMSSSNSSCGIYLSLLPGQKELNKIVTPAFTDTTESVTIIPPDNWTEIQEAQQATPTVGLEAIARDTGFVGTTVTWGSPGHKYASFIIELNGS